MFVRQFSHDSDDVWQMPLDQQRVHARAVHGIASLLCRGLSVISTDEAVIAVQQVNIPWTIIQRNELLARAGIFRKMAMWWIESVWSRQLRDVERRW